MPAVQDCEAVIMRQALNELDAKLPDLIRDLLNCDDCDDTDGGFDIPVEVIASYSRRVRVGAQAA